MNLKVPPNESEAGRAAIIRLEHFESLVRDARENLDKAIRQLATERMVYAGARPITEAELMALTEHVRSGGALCCLDGLAWLRGRLPEPWAWAINGWAYENLSCSTGTVAERVARAEKVRAMPLQPLLERMRQDDHVVR